MLGYALVADDSAAVAMTASAAAAIATAATVMVTVGVDNPQKKCQQLS
jgi:hypothetical protein